MTFGHEMFSRKSFKSVRSGGAIRHHCRVSDGLPADHCKEESAMTGSLGNHHLGRIQTRSVKKLLGITNLTREIRPPNLIQIYNA